MTHNVILMDVEDSGGESHGDEQVSRALATARFFNSLIIEPWAKIWLACVCLFESFYYQYLGESSRLIQRREYWILKIVFEKHLSFCGKLNIKCVGFLAQDLRFNKSFYQPISVAKNIPRYSSPLQWYFAWKPYRYNHNRIWDSVQKPEESRNKTPEDFFDFGFESLTPKSLASEQHVDLLWRRFVRRESTEYVFNRALPNTILAWIRAMLDDDLGAWHCQWMVSLVAKNPPQRLDLPGQHELLARDMCDKIPRLLLERYRNKIVSQLAILNEGQVIDGLGL